ncbi:MAG: DUF485 domain-containing protein [Desulfobacterales bacterium]|nr:DUF485 domain-containing protein [Desulfobacterales bacterium]
MAEHGPATDWGEDKAADYKAKLGIYLFLFYFFLYAGFVAINTVNPKLMGVTVFAGLNLACVYGFGLIILAIIMGLIYNAMCSAAEDRMNGKPAGEDK